LGKVRPEYIKRIARELIDRFPSRFSEDFGDNKQAVSMLTQGVTPKVRNRVAGYITHILAGEQTSSSDESTPESG
jgi:small subunit ribosomal protein S17e